LIIDTEKLNSLLLIWNTYFNFVLTFIEKRLGYIFLKGPSVCSDLQLTLVSVCLRCIQYSFNSILLCSDVYMMQFLSLLDSSAAFNCEVIRDCYEAFALYCFERYLIACLGMSNGLHIFIISLVVVIIHI